MLSSSGIYFNKLFFHGTWHITINYQYFSLFYTKIFYYLMLLKLMIKFIIKLIKIHKEIMIK